MVYVEYHYYSYYYYYCYVIIDHNNAANLEYTFSAILFFLPLKESQCQDIRRKIFEFTLESRTLLVHSISRFAEVPYEPPNVLVFTLPPDYSS